MANYKINEIIPKALKIVIGISILFFSGTMIQSLFEIGKEVGQAVAQWI